MRSGRADAIPGLASGRERRGSARAQGELLENDLVAILSKRLDNTRGDVVQQLVSMDGIGDALERADRGELSNIAGEAKKNEGEREEFAGELSKLRTQAKAAKRAKACSALQGKRFPKGLPDLSQRLSKTEFDALLPPGVRGVCEAFHGGYRIYWSSPPRTRSATWDLHGNAGAAMTLLSEAWGEFEARTGVPCPIPGICSGV